MKTFSMLSVALMMACSLQVNAQNKVTIKGHVKFIDPGFRVTVYQREGTIKNVLAEAEVDPNTQNYTLEVPVAKPGVAVLDCEQWQSTNVWLQDENLDVDFRGKDTAKVIIKNPPYVHIKNPGKNNELMNWLNYQSYRSYQSMIAISQSVYKAEVEDAEKKNMITSALYSYNNDNDEAYSKFLVEHYADRPSVMVAIDRLNYDTDTELIEGALNRLVQANAANKPLVDAYRNEQIARKEAIERMKVGAPAPALEFQDTKGKVKHLADFKGKVIVLDFWASWCGPCRQEVPNMKEYYAGFDKKKVEFLSVSIDEKKAAWEKALKEEGMAWSQGWTPDGGKVAMETYQFGGIPFIIVIDKDGKIYRKNVRGEKIRQAVQDCLDGKPAQEGKTVSISMGAMMM